MRSAGLSFREFLSSVVSLRVISKHQQLGGLGMSTGVKPPPPQKKKAREVYKAQLASTSYLPDASTVGFQLCDRTYAIRSVHQRIEF
jgi:hypothetical protein